MKTLILAIALLGFASVASADCTTNTITTSTGKLIICTTCCTGNNCTTNCY